MSNPLFNLLICVFFNTTELQISRGTRAGTLACWWPRWDRTVTTEAPRSSPLDSLTWDSMWTLDLCSRSLLVLSRKENVF